MEEAHFLLEVSKLSFNDRLNYNNIKKIILDILKDTQSSSQTPEEKTENYKTQKIALNLLVKSSDVSKLSVAQNIKGQLENQGIRINIVQASDEQYNKAIESKNYDIALCSMYVSPSPNLETFFGEGNLANYSNEEVTDIMNQVKNTTDENILKEKYKRLIEIYKSDVPYLSLYNNKYTIAYSSELVGDLTPNWFYLFYGIEGWYK